MTIMKTSAIAAVVLVKSYCFLFSVSSTDKIVCAASADKKGFFKLTALGSTMQDRSLDTQTNDVLLTSSLLKINYHDSNTRKKKRIRRKWPIRSVADVVVAVVSTFYGMLSRKSTWGRLWGKSRKCIERWYGMRKKATSGHSSWCRGKKSRGSWSRASTRRSTRRTTPRRSTRSAGRKRHSAKKKERNTL